MRMSLVKMVYVFEVNEYVMAMNPIRRCPKELELGCLPDDHGLGDSVMMEKCRY